MARTPTSDVSDASHANDDGARGAAQGPSTTGYQEDRASPSDTGAGRIQDTSAAEGLGGSDGAHMGEGQGQ
jgi:hypothetical protein